MKLRTNILITAVLFVAICVTIDGIAVDCSYRMDSFASVGIVYTCDGRVSFDGNESVTAVSGNHQTGKGYEDVGGIELPGQNLEFFPTNFESFFPNIIVIFLFDNIITSVSNRHLIPFPNLEFLSLQQNKITSIDGDLFEGLDSMRLIAFRSNTIRHVGHDLKLPINGQIYFGVNPCINEDATTPDAVANLKLNLLRNCPPTIAQIENSLEQRQNLLAHIDGQVQTLIENNKEMNDELATLRNEQVHIDGEVQTLIKNNKEMNDELVTLRNKQVHIDGEVQELIKNNNEMNDELATLRNEQVHIDGEVQELIKNNKEMNDELVTLRNEQVNQWHVLYDFNRRIEHLESIFGNAIKASAVGRIDTFDKND